MLSVDYLRVDAQDHDAMANMQDNDVVTKSCHALSSMAWTAPKLILPLVQERFEVGSSSVL